MELYGEAVKEYYDLIGVDEDNPKYDSLYLIKLKCATLSLRKSEIRHLINMLSELEKFAADDDTGVYNWLHLSDWLTFNNLPSISKDSDIVISYPRERHPDD